MSGLGRRSQGIRSMFNKTWLRIFWSELQNDHSTYGAYLQLASQANFAAVQAVGAGQAWYSGQYGSTNYIIYDYTNGKTPFTIVPNAPSNSFYMNSSGLVGIGTATPQTGYILTTNGNIYVSGYITMTSDRRLKKNIHPLEADSALDKIAALRPVTFTWKKTNEPDMGLIAQEVRTVFRI